MMIWILNTILLGIILFFFRKKVRPSIPQWVFFLSLVLKIVAGFTFGWVYTYYYQGGDSLAIFQSIINNIGFETEPRTYFFISLCRPLVYATGHSYWITTLHFGCLSFMACWYAFYLLDRLFPSLKWLCYAAIFLCPSLLFWSSGFSKDSLMFSAIVLFFSISITYHYRSPVRIVNLLILLLSAFILFKIKHYAFIACLIFVGLIYIMKLLRDAKLKSRLIALGVFLLVGFLTQRVHPYMTLDRIPGTLHQNNQKILAKSNPNSSLPLEMSEPNWQEVAHLAPKSFWYGVSKPTFLDDVPRIAMLHQLENTLLLLGICYSAFLIIFKKQHKFSIVSLSIICYVVLLATILPLASPNVGSLVRYKIAYMPHLIFLSFLLPYLHFQKFAENNAYFCARKKSQ